MDNNLQKKMKKVLIIAEAGVNHNGKLSEALKLCDEAYKSGVDAVKFQTWKTENVLTRNVVMATYQQQNLHSEISQFEMAKKLELSFENFIKIKLHCDKIGIQFLSTPEETDSLDFLLSLGIEKIKIGSGDITNIPFLRKVGETKKDVILSTGMSYLGDLEKAYYELLNYGAKSVALLHCTTNYPCPMDEVNLNAMLTLKEAFKCRVGYSDHTEGIEISIAAVALGAEIIEKHFTLDKSMDGPDHKASLDPFELSQMVNAIRNIEKALGNGIKVPNESEKEISKVVLKSIVAKKNITKGDIFSEDNLTVKRASNGISACYWDFVIGKKAFIDYKVDDSVSLDINV